MRWRNFEPLWWNSPSKMPLDIANGFEYLCVKYGRNSLTPNRDNHNALVEEAVAKMNKVHTDMGLS